MVNRMNNEWRYYITHNSITQEVHPVLNNQFSWERDGVRYRRKLDATVKFMNNDCRKIYQIEQSADRCLPIYFEIKRSCNRGQSYTTYWNGVFSVTDCKFNMNRCVAEVKPGVNDKYSCLIGKQDREINIVESGPLETILMNENRVTVEYTWCAVGAPDCVNPLLGWALVHTYSISGVDIYYFFCREVYTTLKIAGVSYPPSGDLSWTMISDTSTTATYARPYIGGAVSFTSILQPSIACGAPPPAPATITGYGDYTYVMSWQPLGGCESFYIAIPVHNLATYTQFRTLYNAVNYLVQQICPGLTLVSDFFEWNPIGDAPDYASGINYVTGAANVVSKLAIAQKSDIINPLATQKATIGNISFKKLMDNLKVLFNVDWFIDNNNNLRIEHSKYFDYSVGHDSTTGVNYDRNKANKMYSYKNESMPAIERFTCMEAFYIDFVGKDIMYDSACVTNEGWNNIKQYIADQFTTEVNSIQSTPEDISKTGFVLAVYYNDGSNNILHQEVGRLSGNILNNAHLSWANLHYNYHRYGRVLLNGTMNNVPTAFFTAQRNKVQESVHLIVGCCGQNFDPTGTLIKTHIGNGEVESATEHYGIVTATVNI